MIDARLEAFLLADSSPVIVKSKNNRLLSKTPVVGEFTIC